MSMLRRVGRTLAIPTLMVAALFCFYLWLFHGWLAGGPPSPNPEWHRAWSERFLLAGMVFALTAIVLAWRRRRGITPVDGQSPGEGPKRGAA